MLRTLLLSVAFAAFTFSATAQKSTSNSLTKREIEDMTWVEAMQDYRVNFHTVVKKFDDAFEGKTYEKGHGWKQFKRWQHFMSRAWMPMAIVRTQACCTKRSKSKNKAVRLNMETGLQWDLLMRRLAEELVVLIMLLSIHSTMTPFTREHLQVDCG